VNTQEGSKLCDNGVESNNPEALVARHGAVL